MSVCPDHWQATPIVDLTTSIAKVMNTSKSAQCYPLGSRVRPALTFSTFSAYSTIPSSAEDYVLVLGGLSIVSDAVHG